MRNRLIYILLLCATGAAAQIPTLTNAANIKFVQGNTIFDRPVADLLALVGAENISVTGNWTFSSNLTQLKDAGTYFYDDATPTKLMRFQLSGITAATTRNLTVPNADGTIALTTNSSGLTDLTASVTGILPVANGGTGLSTLATGRIPYGNGSSAFSTSAALTFDGTKIVMPNNTGEAQAVFGTFNIQGWSTNNGWLSDNLYYNSGFKYRSNGTGTICYFEAGGFQLRTAPSGTAGAAATVTRQAFMNNTGEWIFNHSGTPSTAAAITCFAETSDNTTKAVNFVQSGGSTILAAFGDKKIMIAANSTPTQNLSVTGTGYFSGSVGFGVDDVSSARVVVRGAGATSGTNTAMFENSSGTDILVVRDDAMSAFGTTPVSTEKLLVRGATSDNTTKAFVAERSSGTDVLGVQNDGKVSINNAAYTEELTINGQAQLDGVIFTNVTGSTTASGHVVYTDDATHGGYMTVGDGDRQLAIMPTMLERHVLDWAVNWTTGRKGAFWTVPARFNGWKISKAYISVTGVGSGAGDDELSIEVGGVVEGVQIVTAGTHTLVMDEVVNTDDVITFNITAISATPAHGLHVALELSKN